MSASTTPSRRPRRYLVAGLATAGLVGGGAVVAQAATAGTASPAASGSGTSSASAPSRPTPPTPKPHLDGTVVSVAGDTITLKDHDGFTRVIKVGSSTKYTSDGKSATLSAVVKGRFVHGEGTVDSDGTRLDATTVAISTSAPKPGGPGGRGPAGRGPGGRGPGRPAGLPKPNGGTAPSGAPAAPKPSSTAHGS